MPRTPHIFVLPPLEPTQVPIDLYGETGEGRKILSQVVATNVNQVSPDRAIVVFRPDPEPRLAVTGWFSKAEAEHVRTAIPCFASALSRLRYVDYAQVEADCIRLGEHLREHLSSEILENASFVSIPRGGTVILGLLSYVLDLDHSQVNPPNWDTNPLVVVDDCFLSGARLARFLKDHLSSSKVIAAGLYAHPDLRAAVEREHPRIRSCITARDLTDHAPAIYEDEYEAWKARWENRETGPRYWTGIPEHLCFPWSEPDYGFWNAETDQQEQAWTVAPPDWCLKTRVGSSTNIDGSVQIQHSSGVASVAPMVFYASFEDRILVGKAESDECLELSGTAADFWIALVTCETISEAHTILRRKYDIDSERLASDLRTFIRRLLDRQLLEQESVDALSL